MDSKGADIPTEPSLSKVEQAMIRHGVSSETMPSRIEAYSKSAELFGVDPNRLSAEALDTSTSLFARDFDVYENGKIFSGGTTPAYRDAISKSLINIDPDVRSVLEQNNAYTLHVGETNPDFQIPGGSLKSEYGITVDGEHVYVPEYYADPASGMNPSQFPRPTMNTVLPGGWRRYNIEDIPAIGNHEFSHVEDNLGTKLGQAHFSESPGFRAAVDQDMTMHADLSALHEEYPHYVGENGKPVYFEIFAETGAITKGQNATKGFDKAFPNALKWRQSFSDSFKEACRDANTSPEGVERLKEWAIQTCTSNDLPKYSQNSNLNEEPTQDAANNDPPSNAGSDEHIPDADAMNGQASQDKASEAMAEKNPAPADMDGYKSNRPDLSSMKTEQANSGFNDPFGSGGKNGLGNIGQGRGNYNALKVETGMEGLNSAAEGLETPLSSGLGSLPTAAPAAAPAAAPVAAPAVAPAAMPMVPF